VELGLPLGDSGVAGEGVVWDHQLPFQHWRVLRWSPIVRVTWKALQGSDSYRERRIKCTANPINDKYANTIMPTPLSC
jgi:hypothetical protein